MSAEADFLRAIENTPQDNSLRLIFADWLEEQGTPESQAKAEFLRLTVEHSPQIGWPVNDTPEQKRLHDLAQGLDSAWLMVVSRLVVENCKNQIELPPISEDVEVLPLQAFHFICNMHWDDLQPTSDPAVRNCSACQKSVFYCSDFIDVHYHAEEGHCVAVELKEPRGLDDLKPLMLLGAIREDIEIREEFRPFPLNQDPEQPSE